MPHAPQCSGERRHCHPWALKYSPVLIDWLAQGRGPISCGLRARPMAVGVAVARTRGHAAEGMTEGMAAGPGSAGAALDVRWGRAARSPHGPEPGWVRGVLCCAVNRAVRQGEGGRLSSRGLAGQRGGREKEAWHR